MYVYIQGQIVGFIPTPSTIRINHKRPIPFKLAVESAAGKEVKAALRISCFFLMSRVVLFVVVANRDYFVCEHVPLRNHARTYPYMRVHKGAVLSFS